MSERTSACCVRSRQRESESASGHDRWRNHVPRTKLGCKRRSGGRRRQRQGTEAIVAQARLAATDRRDQAKKQFGGSTAVTGRGRRNHRREADRVARIRHDPATNVVRIGRRTWPSFMHTCAGSRTPGSGTRVSGSWGRVLSIAPRSSWWDRGGPTAAIDRQAPRSWSGRGLSIRPHRCPPVFTGPRRPAARRPGGRTRIRAADQHTRPVLDPRATGGRAFAAWPRCRGGRRGSELARAGA